MSLACTTAWKCLSAGASRWLRKIASSLPAHGRDSRSGSWIQDGCLGVWLHPRHRAGPIDTGALAGELLMALGQTRARW
ncbi:hypothetical protein XAP412_1260004 [Xanthomonas phaseoli pv. phaseoli]|uniref:Uncharacterized protein n=1 Tax=Xanthomonas campestris pv. phaseoli TaxID=317013 RepID=A0AB38DVR4_XANCH|nr:hypothetical protein XAP6984_1280026 [Xanthomonas phaseoli pv. phaseoli]SON78965.1 hypothetical protein XAP412_1260004 [Xanthomonas phaseoli pv. phaseoli]SON82289.1 hypothetical protein XAP7430_1270004 [Xanthomonas phaseoli pv. phaseoli]